MEKFWHGEPLSPAAQGSLEVAKAAASSRLERKEKEKVKPMFLKGHRGSSATRQRRRDGATSPLEYGTLDQNQTADAPVSPPNEAWPAQSQTTLGRSQPKQKYKSQDRTGAARPPFLLPGAFYQQPQMPGPYANLISPIAQSQYYPGFLPPPIYIMDPKPQQKSIMVQAWSPNTSQVQTQTYLEPISISEFSQTPPAAQTKDARVQASKLCRNSETQVKADSRSQGIQHKPRLRDKPAQTEQLLLDQETQCESSDQIIEISEVQSFEMKIIEKPPIVLFRENPKVPTNDRQTQYDQPVKVLLSSSVEIQTIPNQIKTNDQGSQVENQVASMEMQTEQTPQDTQEVQTEPLPGCVCNRCCLALPREDKALDEEITCICVEDKISEPVNYCFLIPFIIALSCSVCQFGGGNVNIAERMAEIEKVQHWEAAPGVLDAKQQEQLLKQKQSMFVRLIPMTLAAGASAGGKLMNYSRKWVFIGLNLFGLLACGLSVVDNQYVLFMGRALYGLIGGIIINLTPKMLQETIPRDEFLKGYGSLTHLALESYRSLDMFINNYLQKLNHQGLVLPIAQYKLFYLIPIPFLLTSLLVFICCARKETIHYYVQHEEREEAIGLIKRVVPGKEEIYYESKYEEIREKGLFWSTMPKDADQEDVLGDAVGAALESSEEGDEGSQVNLLESHADQVRGMHEMMKDDEIQNHKQDDNRPLPLEEAKPTLSEGISLNGMPQLQSVPQVPYGALKPELQLVKHAEAQQQNLEKSKAGFESKISEDPQMPDKLEHSTIQQLKEDKPQLPEGTVEVDQFEGGGLNAQDPKSQNQSNKHKSGQGVDDEHAAEQDQVLEQNVNQDSSKVMDGAVEVNAGALEQVPSIAHDKLDEAKALASEKLDEAKEEARRVASEKVEEAKALAQEKIEEAKAQAQAKIEEAKEQAKQEALKKVEEAKGKLKEKVMAKLKKILPKQAIDLLLKLQEARKNKVATPDNGVMEAFKNPIYRPATCTCLALSVLNSMTGIQAMVMFVEPLFNEVESHSVEKPVLSSAHQMQIINSISFGGAVLGVFFVGKFTIRSLFIVGHACLCIILCLCSFLISQGDQILTLSAICFALLIQQILNAAVLAYQADKVMDVIFGLCNTARVAVYQALLEAAPYVLKANISFGKMFMFFGLCQIFTTAVLYKIVQDGPSIMELQSQSVQVGEQGKQKAKQEEKDKKQQEHLAALTKKVKQNLKNKRKYRQQQAEIRRIKEVKLRAEAHARRMKEIVERLRLERINRMNNHCVQVKVKNTKFGCDGTYTKYAMGLIKKNQQCIWKKDYSKLERYSDQSFYIFFDGGQYKFNFTNRSQIVTNTDPTVRFLSFGVIQGAPAPNWWQIEDKNFVFTPILESNAKYQSLMQGNNTQRASLANNSVQIPACRRGCSVHLVEIVAVKPDSNSAVMQGVFKHSHDSCNDKCIWDRIDVSRYMFYDNGQWVITIAKEFQKPNMDHDAHALAQGHANPATLHDEHATEYILDGTQESTILQKIIKIKEDFLYNSPLESQTQLLSSQIPPPSAVNKTDFASETIPAKTQPLQKNTTRLRAGLAAVSPLDDESRVLEDNSQRSNHLRELELQPINASKDEDEVSSRRTERSPGRGTPKIGEDEPAEVVLGANGEVVLNYDGQ